MTEGVAFVEGQYVPADEAKISVFDLGFSRSDAVYDVVSTWKGLFFRFDDHIDRFLRSCDGVRIRCLYRKDEIKRILAECVHRAGLQDAYVEVLTTRGRFVSPGSRDLRQTTPTFIAYAIPYVWIVLRQRDNTRACIFILRGRHEFLMRPSLHATRISIGRTSPVVNLRRSTPVLILPC